MVFGGGIKIKNMISIKELKENGFREVGAWNNRMYFTKNGFDIVEHIGIYKYNKNHLSGYGSEIKTIEELNKEYKKYIDRKIKTLEKDISKKQELLNNLLILQK